MRKGMDSDVSSETWWHNTARLWQENGTSRAKMVTVQPNDDKGVEICALNKAGVSD